MSREPLLDPRAVDFRRRVVAFARAELDEAVEPRDRESSFWREGWARCGEFGLLGLPVPRSEGGSEIDPLTMMLALEGLSYGCHDNGLVFAVANHLCSCVLPLLHHGSAEQKRRYLPLLASGRMVGANAMTEPGAGSDTAAIESRAERRGDHWVLDGCKAYITNAPVADLFVVFARTGEGRSLDHLSAFVVDRTFPGLRVGPDLAKLGLRTTPLAEVTFEECRVPVANLLGGEGNGGMVFRTSVDAERFFLSACHLGAMKRQLEASVARVNQRRQFGRPIGHFQTLAHQLAGIKVDIELAEALLIKIGWLRRARKPTFFEAAAVKLFTSESYVRSNLIALQLHGAAGYLEGSGVERQLRDSLASTLYAGTSEIQREIVAAGLGIDPPYAT